MPHGHLGGEGLASGFAGHQGCDWAGLKGLEAVTVNTSAVARVKGAGASVGRAPADEAEGLLAQGAVELAIVFVISKRICTTRRGAVCCSTPAVGRATGESAIRTADGRSHGRRELLGDAGSSVLHLRGRRQFGAKYHISTARCAVPYQDLPRSRCNAGE